MLPEHTTGMRAIQKRRWLFAAGAVVLAFALYCGGLARGERTTAIGQIRAHRDTVMDTVRVVEQRLRVDTVRVRETAQAAQDRRAAFDSAARAVAVLADSEPETPVALALPALQVCRQALAADTIAYRAVVAELRDMTEDRDAQRKRAQDDERELNVGRQRFGFRTGAAVGVAVVVMAARLVR